MSFPFALGFGALFFLRFGSRTTERWGWAIAGFVSFNLALYAGWGIFDRWLLHIVHFDHNIVYVLSKAALAIVFASAFTGIFYFTVRYFQRKERR